MRRPTERGRINLGATLHRAWRFATQSEGLGGSANNTLRERRTLRDNLLEAQKRDEFADGHFGHKNRATKKDNYVIEADDPIATAKDLYLLLSRGGVEKPLNNGHGMMTTLPDGTRIIFRINTRAGKGSPAISIDVDNATDNYGVISHKIHIIERGKK